MITAAQEAQLRKNAVAKAVSHIGQVESPAYSNRGVLVDACNTYVGNSPSSEPAWCLAHVCYCVGMAAIQMGLKFEDTKLVKSGYCPTEYTHAKSIATAIDPHDVVSGKVALQPGDVMLEFIISEDKGLLPHHAGMIEVPPTKGNANFTTVEGNTVPDGVPVPAGREGEGNGVYRKHRHCLDTIASGHNMYVFVRLF